MNISINNKSQLDEIDKMIFESGVKIKSCYFEKEMDMMIILLNTGKVIIRQISEFERLRNADEKQLNQYEISRTGIHWPELDEDLSLRGFLKNEMRKLIKEPMVSFLPIKSDSINPKKNLPTTMGLKI